MKEENNEEEEPEVEKKTEEIKSEEIEPNIETLEETPVTKTSNPFVPEPTKEVENEGEDDEEGDDKVNDLTDQMVVGNIQFRDSKEEGGDKIRASMVGAKAMFLKKVEI